MSPEKEVSTSILDNQVNFSMSFYFHTSNISQLWVTASLWIFIAHFLVSHADKLWRISWTESLILHESQLVFLKSEEMLNWGKQQHSLGPKNDIICSPKEDWLRYGSVLLILLYFYEIIKVFLCEFLKCILPIWWYVISEHLRGWRRGLQS